MITRGRTSAIALAALLLAGLCFGCSEPDPSGDRQDASVSLPIDTGDPGDAELSADAADATTEDAGVVDAGPAPPFWAAPKGGYTVIFVDIGQGDATVIIADDGSTMLIDGGKTEKLLAQRLKALQLQQLDIVVATHADADHIGGLKAAFDAFDVGTVYWNGNSKATDLFDEFLEGAKDEGAQLIAPKRGETFKLGSLPFEVVHPGALSGDHNRDSIVLMTGCAGAWVLLTGDAEAESEAEMLKKYGISDIDVLKVGHHGSKSSTTQPFLDALKPKDAIISAGRVNTYGHPDNGVVERLKKSGAKIHLTDINAGDDTVMLKTDCKSPYSFIRPFW